MAHLIDLSNDRENIAYVGKRPWHGLGTELSPGTPIETWRIAAGLGFDYRLAQVQFATDPDQFADRTFKGRVVVYRSDTEAPLSVVSDDYHIVQPAQVLEFFRDLTEQHGFELETAGALKGGAVVWALAKTGRELSLGQDEQRQYALLMTSCDKTLSTRATMTSVRVVCWNTLSLALKGASANLVVVKHDTKFDPALVKQNLGLVDDTWTAFADVAQAMTKTKLKDLDAKQAVIAIFGDPEKPADEQPHQRAMAKVVELFNGGARGSALPSADGTAWGLLNATTEYVDHHAPERVSGARLAKAWTGSGEALKRRALDVCTKLAA